MPDPYESFVPSTTSFGRRGSVVTPSDTVDLENIAKGVVALSAGNLAILPADGGDVIAFESVPVGFVPPYFVRRVMQTGTTCGVATVEN